MASQPEGKVDIAPDANYGGAVADVKAQIKETTTSVSVSEDETTDYFGHNPFADTVTAEHWKGVYEKAQYECRHVFDPTLTWEEEEEKRLIRKLDWRVCLWAVSAS
jgi:hypothetical protein